MASRPTTPPRPGGPANRSASAPPPAPRPGPAPKPETPGVFEFTLSRPILAGSPETMTSTLRLARLPGIGELAGWLDESSVEAMQTTLEVLPFRVDWQRHVLVQCGAVSASQASQVPLEDFVRLGQALAPFLNGSRSTGEPEPSDWRTDSDGDPETSHG